MTDQQRALIVVGIAMAGAALVGVVSVVVESRGVWQGMVTAFMVALIVGGIVFQPGRGRS